MNVHFALEICFVKTNLDAKTETATSKSTDTGAGFSLYGISEDGWTAELDRDYVFGESECIINGGGNSIYYAFTSLVAFNSSILDRLSSCTPEVGPAEGGVSTTFSFSFGVRDAEGSTSGVEMQIWGVVISSVGPTDSVSGTPAVATFCTVCV